MKLKSPPTMSAALRALSKSEEAGGSLLAPGGPLTLLTRRRLMEACQTSWRSVVSRLPTSPHRSDGTIDTHIIEDLSQELLLLMLTRELGGSNAIQLLVSRMDASGESWTDAECMVFLFGKPGMRYVLPRAGLSARNCPAIWRWVSMCWSRHAPDSQARRTQNSFFQSLGNRDVAALKVDFEAPSRVQPLVLQIAEWPAADLSLLQAVLEGDILNHSACGRLLDRKEPVGLMDVAACIHVSAVQRAFDCSRKAAEQWILTLAERFSSLKMSDDPLSGPEISALIDGVIGLQN